LELFKLQQDSYANAKAHGFYDNVPAHAETDSTFIGSRLMLMVSELAEALEEIRAGRSPWEIYYVNSKPEGFPVELADLVIRIADTAEWLGIDLSKVIEEKHQYNVNRPYKHGKTI
jgi:NTP pyrophosphatase (non-canonical NTP hydrolase)